MKKGKQRKVKNVLPSDVKTTERHVDNYAFFLYLIVFKIVCVCLVTLNSNSVYNGEVSSNFLCLNGNWNVSIKFSLINNSKMWSSKPSMSTRAGIEKRRDCLN